MRAAQNITETIGPNSEEISFRFVTSQAEIEEVGRFRYRVYAEENGDTNLKEFCTKRIFVDEMDASADILVAEKAGEIIATVRINIIDKDNQPEELNFLDIDRISSNDIWPVTVGSRLAVTEKYKGSLIFYQMCERVFIESVVRSAKAAVVYCKDRQAKGFYKLGFRECREPAVHPHFGSMKIMYLPLDLASLRALRSPFARALTKTSRRLSLSKSFKPEISKSQKLVAA